MPARSAFRVVPPLGFQRFPRPAERLQEVAEITGEALSIHRELNASHPGAFQAELAQSLRNHGAILSRLGHLEEAVSLTREALVLHRRLAEERPLTYLAELAFTSRNLAVSLADLGRHSEAFATTSKALEALDALPAGKPGPPPEWIQALLREHREFLSNLDGLFNVPQLDEVSGWDF